MTMIRRFPLFVLFTLLLVTPLAAQDNPQQDVPKFKQKVNVDLVLLDATVTDSAGRQILGLNKDDFIVTEDGKPQNIDSVEYFTNRRLLTGRESEAAFSVEHVREERYFILFFHRPDYLSVPALHQELLRAKQAAERFVDKEILPEDKVAVVGHDFRLKIYSDFTSDHKQLHRALDEAITFSNGLVPGETSSDGNSIFAHLDRKTLVDDTGRIYAGLQELAKAVTPIQGRKTLVLFSPGMGEPIREGSPFLKNEDVWFKPMVHALNEANISVYSLRMQPATAGYAVTDELLFRIATETGGEFYPELRQLLDPVEKG